MLNYNVKFIFLWKFPQWNDGLLSIAALLCLIEVVQSFSCSTQLIQSFNEFQSSGRNRTFTLQNTSNRILSARQIFCFSLWYQQLQSCTVAYFTGQKQSFTGSVYSIRDLASRILFRWSISSRLIHIIPVFYVTDSNIITVSKIKYRTVNMRYGLKLVSAWPVEIYIDIYIDI